MDSDPSTELPADDGFPRPARATAFLGLALLLSPVVAYAATAAVPGYAGFVVATGSMEPAVSRGSLVFVAEAGDYGPGDVVAFRTDDRVVTHRIVAETDRGYRTRGDANAAPDGWRVHGDRIVGVVLVEVPLYGYLLAAAGSPAGRAAFVAVPALLLLTGEVRRLRRDG